MLRIKYNSPVPIYEQLIKEIERMVSMNELSPGDELPSIRTLARQLEISNNTVARAYMELERKGIVTSNGRKGTFIREPVLSGIHDASKKVFKDPIITLLKQGFEESEIRKLFNQGMSDIFK